MHAILLAGAALVGLPILLHLIMKQEPKRLLFPAFRFLTQKLKTNQRKLRLRHFILLALRMLLIALFCLTLYQPMLKSDRLNIRGEQPVATVVIIDTSPSMGYVQNDKSRLDDAKRRVLELFDELPEKSPVAVVTTDDPGSAHWVDLTEARKLVQQLDKPRGGSQPLAGAVAHAYQLFAKVEAKDIEETEQLPKLLFLATDRAAASWDATRTEDIKKLRDKVPDPKPAHAVVDVGVDQAMNVGILAVEMKPQVIAANQTANVTVTVAATGPSELPPVDAVVVAKVDGAATPAERKAVKIAYGRTAAVVFPFKNLKPGVHQVEFSLEAPDKLMFDNSRFLTFKVGETRRVLTIAEDPATAVFWQIAIRETEQFDCLVVSPDAVKVEDGTATVTYEDPDKPGKPLKDPLRAFDVVCLFSIPDPSSKAGTLDSLWDRVRPYVESGGKLVIVPDERVVIDGYKVAKDLMPGDFKELLDTRKMQPPPPKQTAPGWTDPRDGVNGVTWALDDKAVQHPMLRPFQGWSPTQHDVLKLPRRAIKYWDVQKAPEGSVVVFYNDAEKPADRHPAVLERAIASPKEPTKFKGRVVLLTTRMHPPVQGDTWNDYWESENTWTVVFPWLIMRYLAGDTADANFNHSVGQVVTVPLPKGGVPRGAKALLDNPNVSDPVIDIADKQTEVRIGPPRTSQPGSYRLYVEGKVIDGFSLNVPAEESTLEKVPVEGIEELTGKGSVVPLTKDVKLRDILKVIVDQPIDLFPWLLILVLLLLATEGLVANRFYRRVR